MTTPPLPGPGTVVGGDFKIVRVLSTQGSARVYIAEQLSTGANRALKLMRPDVVVDAAKFDREVRVGAEIESEHLVNVLGGGIDEGLGVPFIAMELLPGESLELRLARAGKLSFAEASRVLSQVCDAVGAAHGAGVVHQDLKPRDVWLVARGQTEPSVRVLDFGVACVTAPLKVRELDPEKPPSFVAPELFEGQEATPRADVWSLGLIAFQALTGKPFWSSLSERRLEIAKLVAEIRELPIPAASVRAAALGVDDIVSAPLDEWFARCLSRDPSRRFAEAGEAYRALEPLLGIEPSAATPEARGSNPVRASFPARAARKRTETAQEALVEFPALPPPVESPETMAEPPDRKPVLPQFKETARDVRSEPVDADAIERLRAQFQGFGGASAGASAPPPPDPGRLSPTPPVKGGLLNATMVDIARSSSPSQPVAQRTSRERTSTLESDGGRPFAKTLESGSGRVAVPASDRGATSERTSAPTPPASEPSSAGTPGKIAVAASPAPEPAAAPAPAPAVVTKTDPRLTMMAGVIIVLLLVIVVLLARK